MKIQRAFKVRPYPTEVQRFFLNKTFGRRCFLYNLIPHTQTFLYLSS
ncbi:MAG: helix-turn-helix domain-containing protein [Treponema sp.]|nr:helix-turn-helix domain-containing protein [Treponema sp.]